MPSSSVWPAPWRGIDDESERTALAAALWRELPAAHDLAGHGAIAVARRDDSDDVLFELDDGRIAEVHLTWAMGDAPAVLMFPDTGAWSRDLIGNLR